MLAAVTIMPKKEGQWICVNRIVSGAEFDGHFVPVRIQFLGEDNRQRGRRTLAHFCRRSHDSDRSVGSDAHPRHFHARAVRLRSNFCACCGWFQIEAEDQTEPAHANANKEVATL